MLLIALEFEEAVYLGVSPQLSGIAILAALLKFFYHGCHCFLESAILVLQICHVSMLVQIIRINDLHPPDVLLEFVHQMKPGGNITIVVEPINNTPETAARSLSRVQFSLIGTRILANHEVPDPNFSKTVEEPSCAVHTPVLFSTPLWCLV